MSIVEMLAAKLVFAVLVAAGATWFALGVAKAKVDGDYQKGAFNVTAACAMLLLAIAYGIGMGVFLR